MDQRVPAFVFAATRTDWSCAVVVAMKKSISTQAMKTATKFPSSAVHVRIFSTMSAPDSARMHLVISSVRAVC